MICSKCDAHIADDTEYCPECGSLAEETARTVKTVKKPIKKVHLKLILVGVVLVAIVIGFVVVLHGISGNKGQKIAASLSENLGRSIAAAEKNSNITLASSSENAVLKQIVDYDYIIEADKSASVEGIRLPEWAVFVSKDENEKIQQVTYYNFKLLSPNWKGSKASKLININEVEYGMTVKETEKLLSIRPLAVIYSNDDVITYEYKYYFIDEKDNNEKAYNLTVHYDVSNTVKDIFSEENDYISYLLKF